MLFAGLQAKRWLLVLLSIVIHFDSILGVKGIRLNYKGMGETGAFLTDTSRK